MPEDNLPLSLEALSVVEHFLQVERSYVSRTILFESNTPCG
jgi:hypothetical protein